MSSFAVVQHRPVVPVRRPALRGPRARQDRFSEMSAGRVGGPRSCVVAAPRPARAGGGQLLGMVVIGVLFALALGVAVWSFLGFSNEPISVASAILSR